MRIVIFVDNLPVMAETLKELIQARESLIFLLQKLGFVINLKKSKLTPVKEIDL